MSRSKLSDRKRFQKESARGRLTNLLADVNEISNDLNDSAIHLSLQGKGGVGKSFIASVLAQYFLSRGHRVRCIDTDPVNHTLAQYKQLPVKLLKLLRGSRIDERRFDALLDAFLKDDVTFVVDNGAATFIPLWICVNVLTFVGSGSRGADDGNHTDCQVNLRVFIDFKQVDGFR